MMIWGYPRSSFRRYRRAADQFDRETMQRACIGFEWITEFIILSATKDLSFDKIEFNTKWGRISCGRSDFYSYRRRFYSNLSKELNSNTGGAAVHGI